MRYLFGLPEKIKTQYLALILPILCGFNLSLAIANSDLSGLTISQIEIIGNSTTQTRFVLKWAGISVGDLFDQHKLDQARQNILDTSLFKQVTLRTAVVENKVKLVIEVEEKIYTLLLPRISRNGDGDVKLGVNLKLHNISGANQTLNVLAEKSRLSNGDDGRRYRVRYDLPQFSHPYRYYIGLSDAIVNTKTDGFRNIEFEDIASLSITRYWHWSQMPIPLSITGSIIYQSIRLQQPYPVALNEISGGTHNRLRLRLEYDAIHTQQYRRYGYFHSLELQQGFSLLDSDYLSRSIKVESRFYYPLNRLDNLNARLLFGDSKNSPYDVPFYNLGGSGTLRGLEQDSISGDTLLLGNFEYVKGFETYPSFRVSSFIDIGNVYPGTNEVDLGDMQTSVGFGARWKAVSFVKTDLFVDYAYNIDTENSKIYGGTSLTF